MTSLLELVGKPSLPSYPEYGRPCSHKGCLSHVSHPCEVCGRVAGRPTFVFVYGANTQGRHGRGAAADAVKYFGARYGMVHLNGRSYGFVTKELRPKFPVISPQFLVGERNMLLAHCRAYPNLEFCCTEFGTGLAGFSHETMASVFDVPLPPNLLLPERWKNILLSWRN